MTEINRWGASPEQWRHLIRSSVLPDLLPVVSNPHAEIDPESRLGSIGKTPSRYNKDGKVVGVGKWTQLKTTEYQAERWSREPDYGICIQTRRWRAIDIDIGDPARARVVSETIGLVAGEMPVRTRANSGKCLLVFELQGDVPKRIIRTPDGIIEFLATGQQFIACGTHTSGVKYEWPSGLPGERGEVPRLSLAEFDDLWRCLADAFGGGLSEEMRGARDLPAERRAGQAGDDALLDHLHLYGWVQEEGRDGRVFVRCPWEDEHTSDTGVTATTYFPAGVGGLSQPGFKCLHAHCADKHIGLFKEAVGYNPQPFEDLTEGEEPEVLGGGGDLPFGPGVGIPPALLRAVDPNAPIPFRGRDSKGYAFGTAYNIAVALRRPDVTGCLLAYDRFTDQAMCCWTDEGDGATWRSLGDHDIFRLQCKLDERLFKAVSGRLVSQAVHAVVRENSFDSAIEWAKSLQWDGVPRVEQFFTTYLSVEDGPYPRAVANYLWTAMAARALQPGHKADMVVVLHGAQGVGKTTTVQALAPTPEAFAEVDLSARDDNMARMLRGKLVGELAELRGLQTREGGAIKAWISRDTEEWTPKFKEFATTYKRRVIFVGTTNDREFLDDDTGERRWLPITVGVADLAALKRDVGQLWAEAVAMFCCEGVLWRDAQELAGKEHAKFKVSDDWEDIVRVWLDQPADISGVGEKRKNLPVRSSEVLTGAIGLAVHQINKIAQMRLGKILRKLGYETRAVRSGEEVHKAWVKVTD